MVSSRGNQISIYKKNSHMKIDYCIPLTLQEHENKFHIINNFNIMRLFELFFPKKTFINRKKPSKQFLNEK